MPVKSSKCHYHILINRGPIDNFYVTILLSFRVSVPMLLFLLLSQKTLQVRPR